MLAAIALYRLPDFVMGPMYNPYYHDLGLPKDTVAAVRGSVGPGRRLRGHRRRAVSAPCGSASSDAVDRRGPAGVGTAAFALLTSPQHVGVRRGDGGDNFAQAFAGVALVAYMSSLTGLGYTATQYALLSSTYACSASS
jgi:PAT family beta-lactamase induction signal transducer AmpG